MLFTPCKYESVIDCATDYFLVPNPPHVTCRLCSVCTRYLRKSQPVSVLGSWLCTVRSCFIGLLEEVLYEVQTVRRLARSAYWHLYESGMIRKRNLLLWEDVMCYQAVCTYVASTSVSRLFGFLF